MIFPSCPRSTPSVLYACSWHPTFATWLVRLVGRSRSGRRVPRLRSRCATAFPKLRRHPRPSQKRRCVFGLRPFKVRSCSPALGVHWRMLACGRPLSPAQTAHASIRECPLAYGCLPSPRRAPPTRWQRRLPMDHSGEQRRGGSCSRADPSSGTTCRSDERRLPSDRPRPSHLELRSGLPERNRNAMGSAGHCHRLICPSGQRAFTDAGLRNRTVPRPGIAAVASAELTPGRASAQQWCPSDRGSPRILAARHRRSLRRQACIRSSASQRRPSEC